VSVLLTRSSDVFVELDDRARYANNYRADLFVAVHADYNPDRGKRGHSILLPQSGNPKTYEAARDVSGHMAAVGSPFHVIRTDDRGLIVLKRTNCPAILVELGFLSNPYDAAELRDAAFRERVAAAIADGIVAYLQQEQQKGLMGGPRGTGRPLTR
jgi:N-acetylmuramoyl-L-alanine amidase